MGQLCIGATSRLVVEEAAKLGVAQIIASRRQVNATGGYTGMTQADLVKLVKEYCSTTDVIRDHGGPHQNGEQVDDWMTELDDDVNAGFDGLHLDVSKVDREKQVAELKRLLHAYAGSAKLQIGGERDTQEWLNVLLATALGEGVVPTHCIIAAGGHVMHDQQAGRLISHTDAAYITKCYHAMGVHSVAHNMDFVPDRRTRFSGVIDAINIAPELGVIETEAWLRAMPFSDAQYLLQEGHDSLKWHRWFGNRTGTAYERARCGLRYIWAEKLPVLSQCSWYPVAEDYVRKVVSDAITAG